MIVSEYSDISATPILHVETDNENKKEKLTQSVKAQSVFSCDQPVCIVESQHPYTQGQTFTMISSPGAVAYHVRFDSQTSITKEEPITGYKDHLTFFRNTSYSTFWGSRFYSGSAENELWNPDYNLTIYDSTFIIYFASFFGSSTDYGYKLYVYPLAAMPGPKILMNNTNLQAESGGFHPFAPYNIPIGNQSMLFPPGNTNYIVFFSLIKIS